MYIPYLVSGDIMLTSLKSCRSPCTWHCHNAAERKARFYPSRDVATQFIRFESGGLQHLGYPSREGLPFADPWCEGVERTSAERMEAAGPHQCTIITAAIAQWRSRLNACVRVNGGHFEHTFFEPLTFCCFMCFIDRLLLLVYVSVIDINMCKVLILCEMCYFCVWHFHMVPYSSNITNMWQEVLTLMTLAFSCEVVHEILWKSVNICKSYGEKKQWHLIMWTPCIDHTIDVFSWLVT